MCLRPGKRLSSGTTHSCQSSLARLAYDRSCQSVPVWSISLSLASGSRIVSIWTFFPYLLTALAMIAPLSPTSLSNFRHMSESAHDLRRLSMCCENIRQCDRSQRMSLQEG